MDLRKGRKAPWARSSFSLGFIFGVTLVVLTTAVVPGPKGDRSTFFLASTASADDSALCVSGGDTTVSFTDADSLKLVLVWVSFADSTDTPYSPCQESHTVLPDTLPSWFRDVETEFEDYIQWQSYGKLTIDAWTAQHPDADSLKPWSTGKTPCYWMRVFETPALRRYYGCESPGGTQICADGAEGCVNRLVLDKIKDELGEDYFDGVDLVSFIHMGSDFSLTGYAGWWDVPPRYSCTDSCAGPIYCGSGTVQRPIMGYASGDEPSTKYMLAHELGHALGIVGHLPRAGYCETCPVKMGKYGLMQLGAPQPINFAGDSFIPYHLWDISGGWGDNSPNWFSKSSFDSIGVNTLDVRIYDVRSVNKHNAVIVDTKRDTYNSEFWLIHHQNTKYDQVYGGDLLAMWHMRNPRREPGIVTDFDLEAATGKHVACDDTTSNAIAGWDSLECDVPNGHRGTRWDLWADSGPDTLGPNTSPNSNDYSSSAYVDSQSVCTGIAIHDIRLDYPVLRTVGGPKDHPSFIDFPRDYWVDVIYQGCGGGGGIESPFLYPWGGRNFPRRVNLLSGLGQPRNPEGQYEPGTDFLVLANPLPFYSWRYVFKVREDGKSTGYFDQIRLHVVDHDAGVTMAATRAGGLVAYAGETAPEEVTGLAGDGLRVLSERGELVHGEPGTSAIVQWNNLATPAGSGGIVLSASGRERDNMASAGGLAVERQDGRGEWLEVARVSPRSILTDVYLGDPELGRTGTSLILRLRWLDYHALDYVSFVTIADPSTWSRSVVEPDSAVIAYGGSRQTELLARDGSFAILNPGSKLTVAFACAVPEGGRQRSVVLETHGYYVVPPAEEGIAGDEPGQVIQYLDRNRPNPFNPSTHILFGLGRGAEVSLNIYSARGALIRRLYKGPLESGDHDFFWDGRASNGAAVASGMYFYRLEAGRELASGKMVMLR